MVFVERELADPRRDYRFQQHSDSFGRSHRFPCPAVYLRPKEFLLSSSEHFVRRLAGMAADQLNLQTLRY